MAKSAPTVPFSTVVGDSSLSISSEEWKSIERAYGHTIPKTVRQKLVSVTNTFLYWEAFERNAEPLQNALKRAQEIQNSAKYLFLTLHAAPSTPAKVYADHLIKRSFQSPHLEKFDLIGGVLTALSSACATAISEMSQPTTPSYREGETWDSWIRQMTVIATAANLPAAAAKASAKGTPESPFVKLVEAMQGLVPSQARRHWQSKEALAMAIYRARTNTARVIKPRDRNSGPKKPKMSRPNSP